MTVWRNFSRCKIFRSKECGWYGLLWFSCKLLGAVIVLALIFNISREWARNVSARERRLISRPILPKPTAGHADQQTQNTSICPEYTINNKKSTYTQTHRKCRPRHETEAICATARKNYGSIPNNHECPHLVGRISADICRFTDDSVRTSDASHLQLECDLELCEENPLYIGKLQPEYGLFTRPEYWHVARNKPEINRMIRKVVVENVKNGFDFCILSCFVQSKRLVIRQALIFPPYLSIGESIKVRKSFNINIVTLDSVSRQHFFRQLPETMERMRTINKNTRTTILDYEMMQSLGPRTFPNMRALFSGAVDVDSDDELHNYGLSALFSKYMNLGYQTLLQEDSCWFDSWGAIITDNKHDTRILETIDDYKHKWNEINTKLRQLPIDSLGLTHLSCEVFLQYGVTNQFNWPPKVCYNGQLLSRYFLNFTSKLLLASELLEPSFPQFVYTHLNTGHEKTGRRITHSDSELSEFIDKMASMKNTLTILMSDHGPKTSKYSQQYLEGRHEIAQAVLFFIIPDTIQSILGQSIMSRLIANQHLLVSHVDVFKTLISLHSNEPNGLLAPVSVSRTCKDVPIYSFMSCLCDESDIVLPDNDDKIHWLAEFAVGYLNNLILTHFRGTLGDEFIGGFGNCERLIGKSFDKIRRVAERENEVYTFDVIIEKYRREEVFEVAVKILDIPKKNITYQTDSIPKPHTFFDSSRQRSKRELPTERPSTSIGNELPDINQYENKSLNVTPSPVLKTTLAGLELIRWRRVSIFQHFSKCTDMGVDASLCICRKESSGIQNPGRDVSKILSGEFFDSKTSIEFVDSKCLAVLTRQKQNVFRSFEVTNLCLDRIYLIHFDLTSNHTSSDIRTSNTLPITTKVAPWTLHFLTSIPLYGVDRGHSINVTHVITFNMTEIKISPP